MVVALEHLLMKEENAPVEKGFAAKHVSPIQHMTRAQPSRVIEIFMVHWMVGEQRYVIQDA